jgi:hypothetical protein
MTGYRRISAADPGEEALRAEWHSASDKLRPAVAAKLSAYLWQRAVSIVAADRLRHPKAKRNAPVGSHGPSGGRALP